MELRIFGDPVLFHLGAVPVTETMVTSTIVSVVLIGLAAGLRRCVTHHQQHWLASIAFMVVESFDNMVLEIVGGGKVLGRRQVLGRRHAVVATFAGSLFLFIAFCNIAGQLPGVHPVTGSLATTAALAAVVFFFQRPHRGDQLPWAVGLFETLFSPHNPLLLPLHVISELSRTLALAVRLFGNIMSGHLVVGLLVALAGFLVPTPIMALDLLIGLLQAYIFAILTMVYIGAAMSAEEE